MPAQSISKLDLHPVGALFGYNIIRLDNAILTHNSFYIDVFVVYPGYIEITLLWEGTNMDGEIVVSDTIRMIPKNTIINIEAKYSNVLECYCLEIITPAIGYLASFEDLETPYKISKKLIEWRTK